LKSSHDWGVKMEGSFVSKVFWALVFGPLVQTYGDAALLQQPACCCEYEGNWETEFLGGSFCNPPPTEESCNAMKGRFCTECASPSDCFTGVGKNLRMRSFTAAVKIPTKEAAPGHTADDSGAPAQNGEVFAPKPSEEEELVDDVDAAEGAAAEGAAAEGAAAEGAAAEGAPAEGAMEVATDFRAAAEGAAEAVTEKEKQQLKEDTSAAVDEEHEAEDENMAAAEEAKAAAQLKAAGAMVMEQMEAVLEEEKQEDDTDYGSYGSYGSAGPEGTDYGSAGPEDVDYGSAEPDDTDYGSYGSYGSAGPEGTGTEGAGPEGAAEEYEAFSEAKSAEAAAEAEEDDSFIDLAETTRHSILEKTEDFQRRIYDSLFQEPQWQAHGTLADQMDQGRALHLQRHASFRRTSHRVVKGNHVIFSKEAAQEM